MSDLEQVHDDHTSLRVAVDALRATAECVGVASLAQLRRSVDIDRLYLHAELLPHLEAEEEILYPALQEAMGSATATVGMEHDHGQIRALAAEIVDIDTDLDGVLEVTPEMAARIRRAFLGLHSVLLNHFAKEESIYHPYLRRAFSPQRRAELVAALDSAAVRRALVATS